MTARGRWGRLGTHPCIRSPYGVSIGTFANRCPRCPRCPRPGPERAYGHGVFFVFYLSDPLGILSIIPILILPRP
jgi:hypothetical protein